MSKNIEWIDNLRKVREYEGKWSGLLKVTPHSNSVELRKTFNTAGNFSQVLISVRLTQPEATMSMNGKASMTLAEMKTMHGAVLEARIRLTNLDAMASASDL